MPLYRAMSLVAERLLQSEQLQDSTQPLAIPDLGLDLAPDLVGTGPNRSAFQRQKAATVYKAEPQNPPCFPQPAVDKIVQPIAFETSGANRLKPHSTRRRFRARGFLTSSLTSIS